MSASQTLSLRSGAGPQEEGIRRVGSVELLRVDGLIQRPERSEPRGVWGMAPQEKGIRSVGSVELIRRPERSEPRGVWGAGPPGRRHTQGWFGRTSSAR
jgi:hypothetical protein